MEASMLLAKREMAPWWSVCVCLDVWKGSGVEKKDEEQRVGIEVLLYEASLGGRLESYRLRLRVVGMFALSSFVFFRF